MNAGRPFARIQPAGRSVARVWRLCMWVTTMCLASATQISAAQGVEGQSRFLRTVQYLQSASPDTQSDFAATAIASLINAYIGEAKLARDEARAAGHNAGLVGWSLAVDYYARQMPLLLEDIELGLPVLFTIGGENSLAITVADRTVILSHPRLNQQGAFEQEILMNFCSRHHCEEFSQRSTEQEPIPVSSVHVKPDWSFTEQGPVCAHQGISVHFKNEQNLANSRLICEQFLQELMTLTSEFAWQQRHAVAIDWDQLEIQSTPRRPEHIVKLNASGDTLLVTVPLLYRSPGLLQHVTPWIRQRLGDQQGAQLKLEADQYGWQ
jgi:hypothetical protein